MKKAIIWDWIGTLYKRKKGLYPFTKKVLQELKSRGYKFGLVSLTKIGVKARKEELNSSGIMHYFDSIIIDTCKTPKHYKKCMREMGTTSGDTIIVDDRTIRGIKIGNKIGCETYWIQKGEHSQEIPNHKTGEPTYRIDSIKDLLDLL